MADPNLPVRADYRFLQQVLSSMLGGKVEPKPEEFDLISSAFRDLGGSWERIFKGSPQDVGLLKKAVKQAFKDGLLTKKPNWGTK